MSELTNICKAWFCDDYDVIGNVKTGIGGTLVLVAGAELNDILNIPVEPNATYHIVHYYEEGEGDYIVFIRDNDIPMFPEMKIYSNVSGDGYIVRNLEWCDGENLFCDLGGIESTSKENELCVDGGENRKLSMFASFDDNGLCESLAFILYDA